MIMMLNLCGFNGIKEVFPCLFVSVIRRHKRLQWKNWMNCQIHFSHYGDVDNKMLLFFLRICSKSEYTLKDNNVGSSKIVQTLPAKLAYRTLSNQNSESRCTLSSCLHLPFKSTQTWHTNCFGHPPMVCLWFSSSTSKWNTSSHWSHLNISLGSSWQR